MNARSTAPPQLSPRAIILAIVLAMILAAANTYLGLFAGLTIASAIPAAVVSMAVLRVLGNSGILENNIVSTGASAGTSIASGVIFTLPALDFSRGLADVSVLVGVRDRRAGRAPRAALFRASAPLAHRRAADELSGRQWRLRKCSRPATTPRRA